MICHYNLSHVSVTYQLNRPWVLRGKDHRRYRTFEGPSPLVERSSGWRLRAAGLFHLWQEVMAEGTTKDFKYRTYPTWLFKYR